MARSVPRRVPGSVPRPPRPRPDLEARIPAGLRHLPRVCPRCGSDNIVIRYFDNQKEAACEQPRFRCYNCAKTFTLGGKLYKTKKKKAKTGRESGESSGAAARRAPRTRTTRPVSSSSPAATTDTDSSSEEDDEEWKPEQETDSATNSETDSATNSAEEGMIPAEEAESEPGEETPVLSRNPNDHREEAILRELRNPVRNMIEKEQLKNQAVLYLLYSQMILGDIHMEKVAFRLELDGCERSRQRERRRARHPAEEYTHCVNDAFVSYVRGFQQEAYSVAKYHRIVAREAKVETVKQAVDTMLGEVKAMGVELVSHSALVEMEKEAKRLWDSAVKLAE